MVVQLYYELAVQRIHDPQLLVDVFHFMPWLTSLPVELRYFFEGVKFVGWAMNSLVDLPESTLSEVL